MKKIVAFSVFVLVSLLMYSQEEIGPDKFYKYGQFDAALPLYLTELETNASDIDLHYKIGICYLQTNKDKPAAIEYLKYALDNGFKGDDIILELGQAYLYAEKFDEALAKFNDYKNRVAKDPEAVSIADKNIAFCNNAKELMKRPLKVTFENLGDRVNSEKSETNPQIDYSEIYVAFTTNEKYVADFAEFVADVYYSEYKYGRWKRSKSISSNINTAVDHEYLCGSAPNLEALIFRPESYDYSGDLFVAYMNGRRYDRPENFGENINGEKSFESGASLSVTGDTLFFASDREGGFGGTDIYYSLKIGNEWGIPQNLGATINTPYNEDYPTISSDGRTLYFASEGHKSMGGFDIFVSKFNNGSKQWGKPTNFGYPINTTYDDYNIALSEGGRYGYVSQVREGGIGEYDIYKVTFEEKEPYFVTFTGMVAVGDTGSYQLIYSLTKNVSIKVYNKEDDSVFGDYKANEETSRYAISLPPGNYELKITASGYDTYKQPIEIPDLKPSIPFVKNDVFLQAPAPPPTPKPTNTKK